MTMNIIKHIVLICLINFSHLLVVMDNPVQMGSVGRSNRYRLKPVRRLTNQERKALQLDMDIEELKESRKAANDATMRREIILDNESQQ